MSVRMTSCALEEAPDGRIVLRGALDVTSLPNIRADRYQREILSEKTISDLALGFKNGGHVPDVELAQRSGAFEQPKDQPGVFILPGPVFVIDGQQRITAAIKAGVTGCIPRLGATVNFNTTERWERDQFKILNRRRKPLSPSIDIRNAALDHSMVRMLEELTHDHSFALADRVSWSQAMPRTALITALTYVQTVLALHCRFHSAKRSGVESAIQAVNTLGVKTERKSVRENTKAYFELIETCWGIRNIAYRERATHMRGTFLTTLAQVLSDHDTFWRGNELHVVRDLQRKLAAFPVNDPNVVSLGSATARAARMLLYPALVNHLNSGRRTGRLVPRDKSGLVPGAKKIRIAS